jgi:hypothetical protein
MGMKMPWPNSKYYTQNSISPNGDLNSGHPKYEIVLLTGLQHSLEVVDE